MANFSSFGAITEVPIYLGCPGRVDHLVEVRLLDGGVVPTALVGVIIGAGVCGIVLESEMNMT